MKKKNSHHHLSSLQIIYHYLFQLLLCSYMYYSSLNYLFPSHFLPQGGAPTLRHSSSPFPSLQSEQPPSPFITNHMRTNAKIPRHTSK